MNLFCSAFGDLLAMVKNDDSVGETVDDVELVLDEQDRQPHIGKATQLGGELDRLGRVHTGGRRVEQQQVPARGGGAGDHAAAAVGGGEGVAPVGDAAEPRGAR